MLEMYKVAAIFELQDRVSAQLMQIVRRVDSLNMKVNDLNEKFRLFGRGNRVSSLTNKIRALNTELGATSALAKGAGSSLGMMGAGGGTYFVGGTGERGSSDGRSGAFGRNMGRAGVVAGAGLAYGMYQNAKMDDAITRILLTSQVPVSADMRYSAQYKALKDIIQSVSLQTGIGIGDVEEGAVNVVRMMAGFPLPQREGVLKKVLSFAALEHRLKPSVSMQEASQSMVGLMHMSGVYKPDDLEKLSRTMMGISLVTPLNMQAIERAASYAVPVLQAGMNIDPKEVMGLMAMMQRSGIINTKSGTWARSFFTGLIPGTFGSGLFKETKQSKALLAMGLIDKNGKSTILNKSGGIDLAKVVSTMSANLERIQPVYRIKEMQQAFGTRGGSFAALLMSDQFKNQWPEIQKFIETLKSEDELLQQLYTGSEVQKAKVAQQSLTVATMNLTTASMGPLSGTIDALNSGLKSTIKWEEKNPKSASYVADGMLAGVGLIVAKKLGAFKLAKTIFSKGSGILAASKNVRMFGAAISDLALPLTAAIIGIQQATEAITTGSSGVYRLYNWFGQKISGNKNWTLGGQIYDWTHAEYDPNASLAHPFQKFGNGGAGALHINPVARGGNSQPIHTTINLDGRQIANVVSKHQAKAASGPSTGMASFDPSQQLRPVGVSR